METRKEIGKSFSQSITVKALIVAVIILVLLIPKIMIQELIKERQERSVEAIAKIDNKWSNAQTICGPILAIPYSTVSYDRDKQTVSDHVLYVTPEDLDVTTELFPKEKYYGIYKTILYKGTIAIKGKFPLLKKMNEANSTYHYDKAKIMLGISDLRGVNEQLVFTVNGQPYKTESGGGTTFMAETLIAPLEESVFGNMDEYVSFQCNLDLKGSQSINFVPIGGNTKVDVSGEWLSPSFTGNFPADYKYTEKSFIAHWSVLSFNRNIPEYWNEYNSPDLSNCHLGVDLIDTNGHYQQNMRSVKYCLMFLTLTFVVFFFVEVIYRKRIHPIQYLLVGVALVLFYSLLLSISEHLGFAISYLISSVATITMITLYANSIFKNKKQTTILASLLCILYVFLYVTLQLEDIALLIGSIGLFIILGIIMYLSKKIKWYRDGEQ